MNIEKIGVRPTVRTPIFNIWRVYGPEVFNIKEIGVRPTLRTPIFNIWKVYGTEVFDY